MAVVKRMKSGKVLAGSFRDETLLTCVVTLTAAGAIASTDGFFPTVAAAVGPGVVKTAGKVGRYSFTFDQKYRHARVAGVTLEGPADAAMGNAVANSACVRNVTTSGFDVQLFLASSGADAETTSGNKIHVAVAVGSF